MRSKYLICTWEQTGQNRDNWGDALNPNLVQLLSRKKVVNARSIFNIGRKPVYAVIGSVLQSKTQKSAGRYLEVWGAGIIGADRAIKMVPSKIHAVRGPLTREILISKSIPCPEVYGDPAILFSLFYAPQTEKHYDVGIIPHYIDHNSAQLDRFKSDRNITIIDIKSGITQVIDQIASCQMIASSSLHGLIAAESYGIPAAWIQISDEVIGGEFKFRDYYSSTGRNNPQKLKFSEIDSRSDFVSSPSTDPATIDLISLLKACPFIDPEMDLSDQVRNHPMSISRFNKSSD